jgi:hypothetical protein
MGPLGERLGPEASEHAVGGPQLLARIDAALLAAQPLAVHEAGAGEVDRDATATEAVDRLPVERVGLRTGPQQRQQPVQRLTLLPPATQPRSSVRIGHDHRPVRKGPSDAHPRPVRSGY